MHVERFRYKIHDALCPEGSAIDHGLQVVSVGNPVLDVD